MYATARVTKALDYLKRNFSETPEMQLSIGEAAQLTELDDDTCQVVLEALEDARFLKRGSNGQFMRRASDVDETSQPGSLYPI